MFAYVLNGHVCVQMTHMHLETGGDLHRSSQHLLRQGLSLNWELMISPRLVGQWAPRIPLSLHPSTTVELQVPGAMLGFSVGDGDLNSGVLFSLQTLLPTQPKDLTLQYFHTLIPITGIIFVRACFASVEDSNFVHHYIWKYTLNTIKKDKCAHLTKISY